MNIYTLAGHHESITWHESNVACLHKLHLFKFPTHEIDAVLLFSLFLIEQISMAGYSFVCYFVYEEYNRCKASTTGCSRRIWHCYREARRCTVTWRCRARPEKSIPRENQSTHIRICMHTPTPLFHDRGQCQTGRADCLDRVDHL